jgi:hypothetical protein
MKLRNLWTSLAVLCLSSGVLTGSLSLGMNLS